MNSRRAAGLASPPSLPQPPPSIRASRASIDPQAPPDQELNPRFQEVPHDPHPEPQEPEESPERDPHPGDEDDAPNLTDVLHKLADSLSEPRRHQSPKTREPDTFDGSDPRKLRHFLTQCTLVFRERKSGYSDDSEKVLYAISYLKGTAFQWFEPGILGESGDEPAWLEDWLEFSRELRTNFGPHDPTGDAEAELDSLTMKNDARITKYVVEFNRLSSLLRWEQGPLRHYFYKGLPARIKDEIARVGKPTTLAELRTLATNIDARYWERRKEVSRENKSENNPNNSDKKGKKSTGNSTQQGHAPSQDQGGKRSSNSSRTNSGKSNSNSGSSKPTATTASSSGTNRSIADKLGKDGKLTPEERKRRFDNNLCLFCGGTGHVAKDCKKSTSSAAKARAAKAATTANNNSDQGKA